MPQDLTYSSGNGLVSSGNKPLPEPMLTKFYDAIWKRQAKLSLNQKSALCIICHHCCGIYNNLVILDDVIMGPVPNYGTDWFIIPPIWQITGANDSGSV